MRHFYRLFEGVPNVPLMNAIMGHLENFSDPGTNVVLRNGADTEAMRALNAKKFALGIMQLVDGTALGPVGLCRLEPGIKWSFDKAAEGFTRFVTVLLASEGASYLCKDESVALRAGECWRIGDEGLAMNNARDDLVVMTIDIKVD